MNSVTISQTNGQCPTGYIVQGNNCYQRTVASIVCVAYDSSTNMVVPCISTSYNFQNAIINIQNNPIVGAVLIRNIKDPYLTLYGISPSLVFGTVIAAQYVIGVVIFLFGLCLPCFALVCFIILVVSLILIILMEAFLFFEGGIDGFMTLVKAGHFIEILK